MGISTDETPWEIPVEEAARLDAGFQYTRQQILQPEKMYPEHEDILIRTACRDLMYALDTGMLSPDMRQTLRGFIAAVLKRKDLNLALEILGLPRRRGAPSKHVEWFEAECNYEHWLDTGHSDDEALRICWETIHPDKDYATESKRPQGDSTAYDEQVKKIKAELIRRGVRRPAARGRKKNKKAP